MSCKLGNNTFLDIIITFAIFTTKIRTATVNIKPYLLHTGMTAFVNCRKNTLHVKNKNENIK